MLVVVFALIGGLGVHASSSSSSADSSYSHMQVYSEVLEIPQGAWPETLPQGHLASVRHLQAFLSNYTRRKSTDEIFHGFERRGVMCGQLIPPGKLPANDQLVAHTHLVRHNIAELAGQLAEAESGQRGFAMTAKDEFLEPYNTALAAIDRALVCRRQTSFHLL